MPPRKSDPLKDQLMAKLQKDYEEYYDSIILEVRKEGKLNDREVELLHAAIKSYTTDVNVLAVQLKTTAGRIIAGYRKNPDLKYYVERIESAQKAFWRQLMIAQAKAGDKQSLQKLMTESRGRGMKVDPALESRQLLSEYVK